MAISRKLVTPVVGQALSGPLDLAGRRFQTVGKFEPSSIAIYHNGRRLIRAVSPSPLLGDFYISESGGVGSGFDTIDFLSFTPAVSSKLISDYVAA